MKKIVSCLCAGLFALPALLCAADTNEIVSSASSDTNPVTTLPEITITATRIATPTEDIPSSATVITGDEIARSQQPFVADVLRGEPGVEVATTGQPGSQTQVFLRGASADGTLVLIDGIPVNNAFNNSFDFSTLPVNNIERIEILRGPQSTLYGSEALGGVINIVTKNGSGPPTGSAQVEYGSFDSLLTRGSLAGSEGKFSFSADGSFHSTANDRINSAYQGINFSGHLGYQINDWLKASLLATYLKSSDGSPNDIYTDDPNDQLKNENYLTGLTLEADPVEWWDSKVTVSHSHERGIFDEPPPNPPYYFGYYSSRTIADRNRVDFQNIFTLNEQNKFLVGGTFENDSANYQDNYSALARTVYTESAYAEYDFMPVQRVTLTVGGRVDDSSSFGTHGTYQFGGRFTAPRTETIFRANVGTGFLAPSIDDLYYPGYSNPNLKPEESFGWDVGFEQPLLDGKLHFGVTFFHNDYDDLIEYSGVTFEPENIGRARTFGLENFASWTPLTNLTIRAAYTWLDAKDLDTGEDLVRRPQNSGSLDADWKICPRLDATAHALFTGNRTDNNYDNYSEPPVVTLSTYEKVDLGLNCQLTKNFSIYGRVENLLDQHYQEAYGFPALGRFFAAGVIARF
ncbi:MAG TPA: TonB-dependent receptor [Candidatus Aquilonibacter sp.]|nr:TonB-dependent receptor [Candidatus Aquilonibacter sp.]